MAAFDGPLDFDLDAAFLDDDVLAWIARETSKPGRPGTPESWTLHAAPAWSARHLERDPSEVATLLLERFFRLIGGQWRPAVHLQGHRWRFARSAEPRRAEPLLVNEEARIGVAGDWTRGDRVEGAFLSGYEVAGEIARAVAGCRSAR
jgi:predicted NAD/FAD-dependent oxidoreductase